MFIYLVIHIQVVECQNNAFISEFAQRKGQKETNNGPIIFIKQIKTDNSDNNDLTMGFKTRVLFVYETSCELASANNISKHW